MAAGATLYHAVPGRDDWHSGHFPFSSRLHATNPSSMELRVARSNIEEVRWRGPDLQRLSTRRSCGSHWSRGMGAARRTMGPTNRMGRHDAQPQRVCRGFLARWRMSRHCFVHETQSLHFFPFSPHNSLTTSSFCLCGNPFNAMKTS